MAKPKTEYTCRSCGARSPKWSGQCPDCGDWNALEEAPALTKASGPKQRSSHWAGVTPGDVVSLQQVSTEAKAPRLSSGSDELDRVLGGGWVAGSVVLLGGDPGIGKSTLLLQVQSAIASHQPTLYVTGEESASQVAMRAKRLGLAPDALACLTETCVETILATAATHQPQFMILDSIQTLWTEALQSAPGAVAQVRECAARLVQYAKTTGCTVVLVGHVTKEGALAGPRVLEHMVDAVLYFESDSGSRYRLIRAVKNRFGAANELGVFAMTDQGLKAVGNPSAIFLQSQDHPAPGSCVMVTREGTRPLLVEIQALVTPSSTSNPRRVAVGLDANRLALILAVMHRHAGIVIGDQDIFVSVAGGLKITESASDLPIALALMSSLRERPIPQGLVAFGEIGLSGGLRPVYNGQERLTEAASQGFDQAIVPQANLKGVKSSIKTNGFNSLSEALQAL